MTTAVDTEIESVESFRLRAREWIKNNLPPLPEGHVVAGEEEAASDQLWIRARELQKLLYKGGFAGICYPREYGGLGLTPAHQVAFNEEASGHELPNAGTQLAPFAICGPTILDMASEEIKKEHLGALIRGEETIIQFLSEPGGGSDLAGATTRATRDGDVYILNGSKTWSSGAHLADYAVCLARTDWDAPKHRGLSMLLVKIHQPGIDMHRIKQVNGAAEFSQEFIGDVRVPVTNLIGEENQGWTVATRMLMHERSAIGGASPYLTQAVSKGGSNSRAGSSAELIDLVRETGQADDPWARELVAEAHALTVVQQHLVKRVVQGVATKQMPDTAGSIVRLFSGEITSRRSDIAIELGGTAAMISPVGESVGSRQHGISFLFRQALSLAGGSTEMSRNIISERVLAMPREPALDRGIPFNQVPRGSS